jgi:hypothetical protein
MLRWIVPLLVALAGCASDPPPHYPTTPSRVAPEFSYGTAEVPAGACRCPDADCDPRLCAPK